MTLLQPRDDFDGLLHFFRRSPASEPRLAGGDFEGAGFGHEEIRHLAVDIGGDAARVIDDELRLEFGSRLGPF